MVTNFHTYVKICIEKAGKIRGCRVVTVSSLAHEGGKIDWDDINFENKKYSPSQVGGEAS